MNRLQNYYDSQFEQSAESGSIYGPMSTLIQAAHNERMRLLDSLPVEPVVDKTVVDFGTGSWGFACVYPRLHRCKFAVGIDISGEAVRQSERVSAQGHFPYGRRYKYLVSDGLTIPVDTGTVDLFFSGECIEHIENTDAFLDEIYRILRPGGQLILTTPNATPVLYRATGDRYGVGPEHIALMSYEELRTYLEPRFQVEIVKGYNSSVHTLLDPEVTDAAFVEKWVAANEVLPADASGLVIQSRRLDGWAWQTRRRDTYYSDDTRLARKGCWAEASLHQSLKGIMGKPGCEIGINFSGDEFVVLMWSHDWSGIAELQLDEQAGVVDLFSRVGGFRRVVYRNLDPRRRHMFRFRPSGNKNPRAADDQVIFFSASAYQYKN